VPELIARSPLQGQAALDLGGCTLSEGHPGPITSVAPLAGQDKALARALKPLGLGFPAPGRIVTGPAAQIVWTGRGQAFLIGAPPPAGLAAAAATTDQTDGWACLVLEGAGAVAVLARLVPIDLRPAAMPPGQAARAPFNHMPAVILRDAPDRFRILVFRSMARTAWHEAAAAMAAVAARARIA
jgi:sarcosine oxidase subunit gamma